ncbi:MAG: hypothetical protein U0930_05565 [Pirellulales bacterium]
MAKYYVQSGSSRIVMTAADPHAAALWLVHRAMKDVLPAYDDPSLTEEDRCELAIVQGLMQLDNVVSIDERGFDRPDAIQIDVFHLIESWHQLMSALIKMESDLL